MDEAKAERCRDRERRIAETLKKTAPVDLVPLAASAIKKMAPKQQELARKMTLEELARVDLWSKEMYGY